MFAFTRADSDTVSDFASSGLSMFDLDDFAVTEEASGFNFLSLERRALSSAMRAESSS